MASAFGTRREHEEKEPGPDGVPPGFPVSNAAAAASDRQGCVPACLQPRFVQTPSHISRSIRRAAVVSGCPFFKSATSFSQQIPKLICERSCRMAKTLTVNITPILKKESRKRKKNKKKRDFFIFFVKTAGKKAFFAEKANRSVQKEKVFPHRYASVNRNDPFFC